MLIRYDRHAVRNVKVFAGEECLTTSGRHCHEGHSLREEEKVRVRLQVWRMMKEENVEEELAKLLKNEVKKAQNVQGKWNAMKNTSQQSTAQVVRKVVDRYLTTVVSNYL